LAFSRTFFICLEGKNTILLKCLHKKLNGRKEMIYFSCSKKFEFNYWRLSVELNKDESSKLYFFGIMIQKKMFAIQISAK